MEDAPIEDHSIVDPVTGTNCVEEQGMDGAVCEPDDQSFMESISNCLKEQRMDEAVGELADESNRQLLYEHGLDLVPLVGDCLSTSDCHVLEGPHWDVAEKCQDAFQLLAERGNPKEVLLELLGQLETGVPSAVQFRVLLRPIRTALHRTSTARRLSTLRWVLDVLIKNVQLLHEPQPDSWVETAKRIPVDFIDPDVETVNGAADEVMHFCQPLVEEVSLFVSGHDSTADEEGTVVQRRLLSEFLLGLLGPPLCFLDFTVEHDGAKSFQRLICEHLIVALCKLESDFYRFHALVSTDDSEGDLAAEDGPEVREASKKTDGPRSIVQPLALATFSYLVHAEGVCKEHVPSVYSHRHTLKINVPLVCCLLRHSHPGAVQKGLLLAGSLLDLVPFMGLDAALLDAPGHLELGLALTDIAIYCAVQHFRRTAVDVLSKYVERFELDGRFFFLFRMLNTCEHAGVRGLLIQLFKNNLCGVLDGKLPHAATYLGRGLSRMLRIVLKLEDGVRTDLRERCEPTLAALNLLRYLLIRDPESENVSGVWTLVPDIRATYLTPLQTALDLSRTHFKVELKRHRKSKSGRWSPDVNAAAAKDGLVAVNGLSMDECHISTSDKLALIQSSLTAFDLIQSVLCRINELLDSREPCAPRDASLVMEIPTDANFEATINSEAKLEAKTNSEEKFETEINSARNLEAKLNSEANVADDIIVSET